jgi:hypothetical protein
MTKLPLEEESLIMESFERIELKKDEEKESIVLGEKENMMKFL